MRLACSVTLRAGDGSDGRDNGRISPFPHLSTRDLRSTVFSAASALYRLWLDSGEYEEYARACLVDPEGQVNRDGLKVARTLSARVPTRLWFFHDSDDGEPTRCPFAEGRR